MCIRDRVYAFPQRGRNALAYTGGGIGEHPRQYVVPVSYTHLARKYDGRQHAAASVLRPVRHGGRVAGTAAGNIRQRCRQMVSKQGGAAGRFSMPPHIFLGGMFWQDRLQQHIGSGEPPRLRGMKRQEMPWGRSKTTSCCCTSFLAFS